MIVTTVHSAMHLPGVRARFNDPATGAKVSGGMRLYDFGFRDGGRAKPAWSSTKWSSA